VAFRLLGDQHFDEASVLTQSYNKHELTSFFFIV
jgi:hypothetical protein